MFFRNVTYETFYEIHNRQSFFHILFIFVTVIVESNGISIIPIDPGCGYDGPAKITANVFSNYFRIAKIGFCIDIEALFVLSVTLRFYFFKRRSNPVFQFIEKSSAERITEIVVVKVFYMAPEAIITVTTFGKDAVDVRIPFEISAKSVENHDISGSEVLGMVQIEKHTRYDTGDGMKETVEEGTILKEEVAEVFINGKNAMAVLNADELKRHTGGAFHSIFVSAGRTKAAVTTKRNKLEITAVGAGVHGAAKRRITAVDHLINIFHLSFSGMKSIFNFFIMVCKDSL